MSINLNVDDDVYYTIDPREQAFHNLIREHVIFLLLLIFLYGSSYGIISKLRKRREDVSEISKFKLNIN